MPTILPLIEKEDFSSRLTHLLDALPQHGIDRCPEALAKKIANLPGLEEAFKQEKDVVKQRKIGKDILAVKQLITAQHEEISSQCYALYRNAHAASLPIVIGGSFLRDAASIHELKNFGVLSSGETSLSHALALTVENKETGSIFCPKPWSLVRNDSFMFGAIQSGHTFYVAGSTKESDLWDHEAGHMKVLGREIAMLALAGYSQVTPEPLKASYGLTFVCLDHAKQSISIEELISKVAKIKSVEALIAILA